MVRKSLRKYMAATLLLPMIASCASNDEPTPPFERQYDGNIIGFRSTLETRAMVESFATGNAIKVWGYKKTQEATSWEQVFSSAQSTGAIEVSYDGSKWSYDQLEYWEKSKLYTFHGFYSNATGSNEPDISYDATENTLTIINFNATNHIDLLYDKTERDYDAEGGYEVSFSFKHLLSQVTFAGKADATLEANNVGVVLTSAKLYGMPTTGNWTSGASTDSWSFSGQTNTTSASPFAAYTAETSLTSTATDLFADQGATGGEDNQILIFPLESLADAKLEITFHYTGNIDGSQTYDRTSTINLGSITNATKKWEAGKRYKYTFTIGSNDYILFAEPTVEKWKPNEIGNDSALDQEENQGN